MRLVSVGLLAIMLCGCAGMERTVTRPEWTLLIHGGVGVVGPSEMTAQMDADYRSALAEALNAGSVVLESGGRALDAVEAAVRVLEDHPGFNAGRGAALTREGVAELDASIMDGRGRRAGAVAQVRTVRNPIRAARLVMDTTGRVMFAGADADRMAKAAGLEVVSPDYFITPRRLDALREAMAGASLAADRFGTVGAVAMDRSGDLAAATSTGGMNAKPPGRIGDSPIIGAGTYADNASCAVSATGDGEYFIRVGVARMICARVAMQEMSAAEAARVTLDEVRAMGGEGGVIVLSRDGSSALSMNTEGMYRGYADATGRRSVAIYADE